ncbi:TM2 domain protein [Marine Group I thaumarchaeote SCGC AAA799-N04]|uniref:TM2 domain protein n=1 Tax=Marine Group I thaumarchaeote SCGC AAA799-N04 TaxID=1502293 RepID=A0A081RMH5_9ARCH|nr:TM2 domain protein [Marine Group I thaumarchaeote SCGC AAA799-N04]
MGSTLLDDVNKLLEMKVGDIPRLEHIKRTLEQKNASYASDRAYLQKLVNQYLTNTSQKKIIKEETSESEDVNSSNEETTNSQFCGICGNKLQSENNFCPKCGSITSNNEKYQERPNKISHISQTKFQRGPEWKNLSTTTVLAVILGIFGIEGVGHFYVGKIAKGIGFLLGAWILFAIGYGIITSAQAGAFGYSHSSLVGYHTSIILIAIGCFIGVIVMFVWQIFDSRKLCRYYNDYLEKNGKKPW